MKKLLLSLAAVGALASAAAPAAAQPWRDAPEGRDRLERRIDRAEHNGAITSREAWRLRASLREADRREHYYLRDGRLSGWERDDLGRRYAMISHRLREARQDGRYDRYDDYGWRR